MTTEKENNREFLTNFLNVQAVLLIELQKFKDSPTNLSQIQTLLGNVIKFETKVERISSLLEAQYEEYMRQMCITMTKYGSVPGGMQCMEHPTDHVPLHFARWAFASSATAKEDGDE